MEEHGPAGETGVASAIEEHMEEFYERQKRRDFLLLHNIPETNENLSQKKKKQWIFRLLRTLQETF